MKKDILIFGYNDYTLQIVKNIVDEQVSIFRLESDKSNLKLQTFETELFDLSDDWGDLKNRYNIDNTIAFCVLEEDAKNIFLTISLRAEFENLTIIALSTNKENANKLMMAGANKVIPLQQTTASIIVDMLEKPIVTEILHNLLYEKNSLKVAQIEIDRDNCFNAQYPSDINWKDEYGIMVLSIIHENGNSEFIYSSKTKHHTIKKGDIFVVIGYEKDIQEFRKKIYLK
ncbi:MAG: NAD-binding protein [Campylobacterota bacterium]|nr:NAD-binding protein [Campylobacterota bacterium]